MADKPLNFLVVSNDKFRPFRVDVTVLFGKELAGRGHLMDWLMQSDLPCDKSYVTMWDGGRVFVGATCTGKSRMSRFSKHVRGLLNDSKMFSLIRRSDYDFVQVKDKFLAAIMALMACRIYKVKFVYWLSYPFPEASLYAASKGIARYPWIYLARGYALRFLLYRIILPNACHVFVQSEQMKKDVVSMGIPENRLTPVPMGVSLEMFPRMSKTCFEERSSGVNKIVYIGTLIKSRRMDFLIRVFGRVKQKFPKVILYMVGGSDDPTDIDLLIYEATRLKVEGSVVFPGQVSRTEALSYVKDADICVSPFYPTPILNSTSPTKLVEYMAMGKAIVANSHPEQSLVLRESNAGICVDYDEKEFSDAIVRLLNNPTLREEMGNRGRRYVEEHRSYQIIASSLEYQYYQICNTA